MVNSHGISRRRFLSGHGNLLGGLLNLALILRS